MSDTATLADHIDQQVDAILEVWKSAVERDVTIPDSDRLSYREFVDHIPELLDRLADRLRGHDADTTSTAQKHGQHRWSQGYEIGEVVGELGHLRSTLMRGFFEFARKHDYDVDRLERTSIAINQVIDEATADSVRQFDEDSRTLSRGMIEAFEERKASAEGERIKLQTLLNNLPVGVWVADVDGSVTNVNREAERLQGFSEGQTVGRVNILRGTPEYQLYRPDGSAYHFSELPLSRALRGETILREDCIWPKKDHTVVITTNAAPLTNPEGEIIGAVVVANDITERKRLEDELALSEARYRGIIAKSPVMIWRADQAGVRDFYNETWLEFRGRSLEEEVGEGWTDGVFPDDLPRYREAFRRNFERREPFEMVYRLRHRDGRHRWVTDRGSPYHDARGTFLGYLGSCMDITARVELEARLEQQSQHKSRLMSALSHDARTPLNAVVLSAKLLESQAKDQDDPEVRECLRTIRNAVRNVLDLLSDLLDLSRIDAGATLAESSRFDLLPTLSECLSSIEPQARDKGLDVLLEPGNLADARLETDRAKLKQILANLLSNALRYTERGRIRLFATGVDGHILIGVQDTGVGIAEADQHRIFDEFAVLEHPNRLRGEGTGLGLAICRRLANLLQGEILLESNVGEGSTFTLALPSTVLTGEPAETPTAPVPTARDFDGAILIAEDHADSRKTLAKVLRRMGYRVLEAEDGREVLALVREERPMVVLMDVNMPGMDGVEATLALRADPTTRDLPIFALTGDVSIVNQQRIGEAGVDGYLEKPVTWDKLEGALAQLRTDPAPPDRRASTDGGRWVRVLMTGGYGCIGSWVARQLVEEGHEAWIFDLREDKHRIELLLDEEGLARVHFLEGDVSDAPALLAAAGRVEATHLLHLAGLQVPTCRADPLLGAKVNILGTLAVFEAAATLKGQVERVVFASSAAVHGPADPGSPGPIGDEVRLAPLTHYGAFKVCNELNAKVYWLDRGVSSVGLRPWTVYGVGRDFGVTSEPTKAIKAVAAGRPFAISYGGLQDLQYVGDVASTFLGALRLPFEGADSFNVRGSVVPMGRFVEALRQASGVDRVSFGDRQLPIAPDLDDARLEAAFGPLPRTSLDQGVAETFRRFSELGAAGRLDLSDLDA